MARKRKNWTFLECPVCEFSENGFGCKKKLFSRPLDLETVLPPIWGGFETPVFVTFVSLWFVLGRICISDAQPRWSLRRSKSKRILKVTIEEHLLCKIDRHFYYIYDMESQHHPMAAIRNEQSLEWPNCNSAFSGSFLIGGPYWYWTIDTSRELALKRSGCSTSRFHQGHKRQNVDLGPRPRDFSSKNVTTKTLFYLCPYLLSSSGTRCRKPVQWKVAL